VLQAIPAAEFYDDHDEVFNSLVECSACGELAIDTETTGLDLLDSHCVLFTWSDGDRRAGAKSYHLRALIDFLEMYPDVLIVWHNAPYDIHILANAGMDPDALWARSMCSQMISNLWDPDGFHDLKGVAYKIFRIPPRKFKSYNFSKMDLASVTGKDFDELVDYATKDAWETIIIFRHMRDDLIKKTRNHSTVGPRTLWEYYLEIERPLSPILWHMERRGIRIDVEVLKSLRKPMAERLADATKRFSRIAGKLVNLNSTPQVNNVIFKLLGYRIVEKTDRGEPSSNKSAITTLLEENAHDPLLLALRDHREVGKVKGTYVDGTIKRLRKGKIHTSLNQATTATGRLSCVSGATLLHTTRGSFRFDEYIPHAGDKTRSHTGALRSILRKVYKGVDKMFRVCLDNGAAMECTADHRVLTPSGWKRVGDLSSGDRVRSYDVSVEALHTEPGEREADLGSLPVERQADVGRDGKAGLHDVPQCVLCGKQPPIKREGKGRAGFEVLPIQDGCIQSHERENRKAAPQLEGGVRRRLRLPDVPYEWEEGIRAQGCVCRDAGDRRRGSLPESRCAPHQRGSAGQQTRQPSNSHDGRSPAYPYEGETGAVVEITALGAMGVWTIEVAGDHSYATHGFYSKNSSNPNLQNIPSSAKDKHKFKIRRAFIPDPGMALVVADYAQVEMRILAHLSQARSLLDPILAGKDMHTVTASRIFDVDYDDIVAAKARKKAGIQTERDDELLTFRSVAKTINFGVVYGLTPQGLQSGLRDDAGLQVTLEEAEAFLDAYWKVHADVREFFDMCVEYSRDHGYIPTYLGRRRDIFWPKRMRRGAAVNEAMRKVYNTPIQGTAAEIMKLAMIRLDGSQELRDIGAELLLQVHDEVVYQVPIENSHRAKDLIVEIMQHPGVELDVPLLVDGGIAPNWEEAK